MITLPPRARRAFISLVLSAAALATITACSEPEGRHQDSKSTMNVETISGNAHPKEISIVCVDGSAFLHAYYEGERISADRGPTMARFPEQDEACGDESVRSTEN